MEDKEILDLFWLRNPDAIEAADARYGSYCRRVAKNILEDESDAEECVNDTYLRAWETIPPRRPENLAAYLGKIARNLAFDRYRHKRAEKRGGGELVLVLDELAECVSAPESVEAEADRGELVRAINDFLDTLSKEKRSLFVCRYWYAESVAELAKQFGIKEGNVSVILSRIRGKLKIYLAERGFEI